MEWNDVLLTSGITEMTIRSCPNKCGKTVMNPKTVRRLGMVFSILCVLALLINRHLGKPVRVITSAKPVHDGQTPIETHIASRPPPLTEPTQPEPAPIDPAPVPEQASRTVKKMASRGTVQNGSLPASQKGSAKPPLVDPFARVALELVGVDPYAEGYWFDAINDPNLPAHERSDLIEDLNELGLSDPKNPRLDDLPIILSRIQLLEEIEAMDQANADAMTEAYKDLVNLASLASGTGGQPVK